MRASPGGPAGIYGKFGATVEFQDGPPGLFLVVSANGDPSALVVVHGGQVALRLNGSGAVVVARMTLTQALSLQRERGIRMVGGIHMNLGRYQALLASLGAVGINQE
ncbi:MAG: hypothetical protein EA350_06705 [Gemmatimonadales bacterium]|nr:MAG: hypothetical protein EA350_06705 [Gemmatimonadales bacterium]